MPDQDASPKDGSINRGIGDFAANEALSRFDLPPAPTHLADWTPLLSTGNSEPSFIRDYGIQKLRQSNASEPDRDGRRDRLIEAFCNTFTSMLDRGGRGELVAHRNALQDRLSGEEDRVRRLRDIEKYRALLLEHLCRPRAENGDDHIEWSTDDVRGEVHYVRSLPEGFQMEPYSLADGSGVHGARIRVSDERLSNYRIERSSLPNEELRFQPIPSTWTELAQQIKSEFGPYVSGRKAAEEILDLLRFRLTLLKQYLWAYDLVGKPPTLTGTVVVPDAIQTKRRALHHALVATEVLMQCVAEDISLSSQADLEREIQARIDFPEVMASPNSVVKGTKRIVDELPYASSEGTALLKSLDKNRDKIRRYASEEGISCQI